MALVIFDCDGVLVDSEMLANELLAEMMTELGQPMTTHDAMLTFGGRSVRDVLALAEDILGREIPEEVGWRYSRTLVERLRNELKPIAGIKAAIAALPHARCVASSSTFERIRLSLEVTGLLPLFNGKHFQRHAGGAWQAGIGPLSPRGSNDGCRARPLHRCRGLAPRHKGGCCSWDDSHWALRAPNTRLPALPKYLQPLARVVCYRQWQHCPRPSRSL